MHCHARLEPARALSIQEYYKLGLSYVQETGNSGEPWYYVPVWGTVPGTLETYRDVFETEDMPRAHNGTASLGDRCGCALPLSTATPICFVSQSVPLSNSVYEVSNILW